MRGNFARLVRRWELAVNYHRENVGPFSSADRILAARIERADALNAEKMARLAAEAFPHSSFISIAGGTAMFTGLGSPMTHAMCIGMNGAVSQEELERLENFYRERGSSCLIDLCPMAHDSVIAFVQNRPYRVVEFNNVLVRGVSPEDSFTADDSIRCVGPQEKALWARTITEGFSEYIPVTDDQVQFMATISSDAFCLLGTDPTGSVAGGAGLAVQDGTALFIGDAVLPSFRRKGWQTRLIRERLATCQSNGCNLATASVLPGSGSHRNYERAGFQLIYMRVNLSREFV